MINVDDLLWTLAAINQILRGQLVAHLYTMTFNSMDDTDILDYP